MMVLEDLLDNNTSHVTHIQDAFDHMTQIMVASYSFLIIKDLEFICLGGDNGNYIKHFPPPFLKQR